MQYGGGAGTGRVGSLLSPLLPRIAVGATHIYIFIHGRPIGSYDATLRQNNI